MSEVSSSTGLAGKSWGLKSPVRAEVVAGIGGAVELHHGIDLVRDADGEDVWV